MDNNKDKEPVGVLFDTINYFSIEDLEIFIDKIDINQATYCLIEGVKSAYRRNAFTMEESEVISKALRKISIKSLTEE